MKTAMPRILVVLKLPTNVPSLIKTARAIILAMTGNANFPNPTPPLATVTAAINALDAAETATKTRAKGTVEARNLARANLVALLHELKAYVQLVADGNPAEAEKVIPTSGMGVKNPGVRIKHDFVVKAGPTSGSVHLVVKAAAHRAAYEWQWSSDGGKTWQAAPSTMQAKTTILGLPVATSCLFRSRALTKAGEADWGQPLALLVR